MQVSYLPRAPATSSPYIMKCIDRISRHIPSRRFEGHDAPFRYLVDLGDVRKDDQPQAISGLPAANPHPLDRRQRERGGGLTSTIECRDSSALPEDALPEPPDGPASDRRCQRKDQILPIPEDRRHQLCRDGRFHRVVIAHDLEAASGRQPASRANGGVHPASVAHSRGVDTRGALRGWW